LDAFVQWAAWAVREFGSKVSSWCTFNEPGVYVSSGYCSGVFPPGKVLALGTAGAVLLRMLRAHTAAYRAVHALHAREGAARRLKKPAVGIVHNLMPYEARRLGTADGAPGAGWALSLPSFLPGALSGARLPLVPPWSAAAAALGHRLWGNEAVLDYLATGSFAWRPLGEWWWTGVAGGWFGRRRGGSAAGPAAVLADDPRPPLDWVGLNFYGRVVLDAACRPTGYPAEVAAGLTDFSQGVWAAGFRDALGAVGALGVPVLVMETGLPDVADGLRAAWADAYLGVVEDVVATGAVDVRGCASAFCGGMGMGMGERERGRG